MNEHARTCEPLSDARLVITGRDVDIVRERKLVSLLSKPGQGYLSFIIDVGQMLGELMNIADATQAFAHGILAPSTVETEKSSRSRFATLLSGRKSASKYQELPDWLFPGTKR